ncbi:hypothetical protein F909_02066 [Acinetobacter sp. ANC 3929]|uniref:DUF2147 domain-containing protein n=1 Tax=unclassified Acinetobacter TaxID=196816 RepID=UPI0002CFADDD|nr:MULTISPECIES: DUF2147 domain-containing protein [unclassified Acinetobacter]ENW80778.1 hypothetical protein F909_02066 [Acinetobacter sp. ANC 3929]MCH7352202.1 DUF2147 domain-containing protein [Acinetobacter sp. NIPH 2023]MCH7354255.1 DUF2147 domain-containing protein [Acinetobacter sp. NIPH 1958]MCH7358756.1 DUF2147 domain-containing protein [Acinetobacter sp. NIPH 2024]
MQINSLMKGFMGISLGLFTTISFASTPEGFWKSIDDRTGEQLSIVEIKRKPDNTYTGTIVYRYPVPGGGTVLTHCVKCPEPFKNKPIQGLQIAWGLKEDPKNPNQYIDGRVLEPKTGNIYKGKAQLSADGKRLRMRGYMGISALGRTQVWIRTDSANP